MDVVVSVDFNRDGDFADTGEDVSDRVLDNGVYWSFGKSQVRRYAPPDAGGAAFELDNTSRDYSSLNGSSPLNGLIVPGNLYRIALEGVTSTDTFSFMDGSPAEFMDGSEWAAVGAVTPGAVHTGLVSNIVQLPHARPRAVGILGDGTLSRLAGKRISSAVHQNVTTSEAMTILLNAAGWPATERVMDVGNVTLRWFWLDGIAFAEALRIMNTEGPQANFTTDGLGRFVFENGTSRTTKTTSTVSQKTFQDVDFITDLSYDDNFKDVIVAAELTVKERAAQSTQQIWSYGQDLVLGNDEVWRIRVRASGSDPFMNAVIPSPVGTNTIQTLTASATLTSGTFKLSHGGTTTAAIDYDATDVDIQAALDLAFGAGVFLVTGGPINTSPVHIEFVGAYTGLAVTDLITLVDSQLNPVTVPASIGVTTIMDGNGMFLEQQRLTPSTTLTGGTFQLFVTHPSLGTQPTPTLNYDDTAGDIETALESIFHIGTASCYDGPLNTNSVRCVFGVGDDYDEMLVVEVTPITGQAYTATISVAITQQGGVPDYVLTAGSVTFTLDRTSGPFVTLIATAGASGATIQGLRLRAQPVTVIRAHEVVHPPDFVAEDQEYEGQIQRPQIREEIALSVAQAQAQDRFEFYEVHRPTVTFRTSCPIDDDAEVIERLNLRVSYLITIVEAQTGISHDFHIERARHELRDYRLYSEFGCEKVT